MALWPMPPNWPTRSVSCRSGHIKFKPEENLPLELAEDFRRMGHDVDSVAEEGLGDRQTGRLRRLRQPGVYYPPSTKASPICATRSGNTGCGSVSAQRIRAQDRHRVCARAHRHYRNATARPCCSLLFCAASRKAKISKVSSLATGGWPVEKNLTISTTRGR